MINITTTKKDRPQNHKTGIFGLSGSGKTSLVKTLSPMWKDSQILYIDLESGGEVLRSHDFPTIDVNAMDGENIKDKMASIYKHLNTPEGLNGFKDGWIVIDSFTRFADLYHAYCDQHRDKFPDFWTAQGKFNGMAMFGHLKKVYQKMMQAFLGLPNCSKLIIFGAQEDGDEGEKKMKCMVPGSYKDSVMFEFDDFLGLEVFKGEGDRPERRLVTGSNGYWVAKSRMSGGSGDALDLYEPADLCAMIGKCYGAKK